MVTKSSSFVVLFFTTLGMITSIIPPLNAQENIEYQAGTLQQQQQQQNQFQYNIQDFQTFTKYMDMYNELYPPQPQQQQGSNYNDFLTFMQYLQVPHDNLYGQKDYIIKLYDNDDNDKDYKYKYKYKKDFEDYKKKYGKDGKGEKEKTEFKAVADSCKSSGGKWSKGQCDIQDEEKETDWEDAICDDPDKNKAFCSNPKNFDDRFDQEKKKPDYDSYEEYNEIVEPICKKHGGKINYGSGECGFNDDIDRAKSTAFEKELDNRGLGADYTAEEEASWNQNQDEVEPIEVSNVSPQFALEQQQEDKEREERIKLTQSKAFKSYVESQGITYDDYDNILQMNN